MEIEYKWNMPSDEDRARLFTFLQESGTLSPAQSIRMHACYYDTEDNYVYSVHAGLRRRIENDTSVCCLKLPASSDGGCRARQEFEVEAEDIIEGLELLKGAGAPVEICDELLSRELALLCETDFVREERDYCGKGFKAKLAFDSGHMARQGRQAPIAELEFEYVSGSEETFHDCAKALEQVGELTVQPASKLARAANL